jgi:tetratricopeptide (TPR) repeat protein
LEKLADVAFYGPDATQGYQCITEAIALYEKGNDPVSAARVRQTFGFVKYVEGEYSAAQAIYEETLATFKAHHYEAGLGNALLYLGRALFQQQLFFEAGQRFTEALQRARSRGDQGLMVYALYFLGRVAYHHCEYVKAQPLFQESLRIGREIGLNGAEVAFPLAFLSEIALAQGDIATARETVREGLMLANQVHYQVRYPVQDIYAVSLILPRCASMMIALGKYVRAVQLIATGLSLYHSVMAYLPLNDQIVFDAPLAAVRNLLPAQQFAEAWLAGERMTIEEAVALAMAETA